MSKNRGRDRLLVTAVLLLCGYIIADLAIVRLRPEILPTSIPPSPAPADLPFGGFGPSGGPTTPDLTAIARTNIFSISGQIPPALGASKQAPGEPPPDAPAVLTSLPLQLVGTLVHANPKRSVATLELKSKNEVASLRVDDALPEPPIQITLVERHRVTFRNTNTRRLEYVEIKEENMLRIVSGSASPGAAPSSGDEISGTENEKTVNRRFVEEQLKDLNSLLLQASSMPVYGPDGRITGYRVTKIQPGSVFERIGIRTGDLLEQVNGIRIDSPSTAVDLFNKLRTEERISLTINRDGTPTNINFQIVQ
jgi:general secretion pathway protein C